MKSLPIRSFIWSRFIWSFIWVVLSASAEPSSRSAAPIVISDFDDTVKVTDVIHPLDAIERGAVGERVFAGMAELYSALSEPSRFLIFLSGSPSFTRHHVNETLREHGFLSYRLYLRDLWRDGTTPRYKREHLEALATEFPEVPFILLGDDGEADPETLSDFSMDHPGKVVAVYIHRVRGRPIPDGITSFHTAFELALDELNAGRISVDQAADVGRAVLGAPAEVVFPTFVECPKSIAYQTSPLIEASAVLQDLLARHRERWTRRCRLRSRLF